MSAIAIIPARGGSKRIPRKNVIDFCGRPLIAWTITAALESNLFRKVLVSTDDPEIAEISRQWGAECPFMRDAFYDDYADSSEATIHALQQAQEYFNEDYEITVQLMSTCPLRRAADVRDAFDAFQQGKRTFQISCFAHGWMNPWWAMTLSDDGIGKPLIPEGRGKRSQDLQHLYCPSGAIWIARTSALLDNGSFYAEPLRYQPMHWKAAVDIDSYDDLLMAKALKNIAN